MDKTYWQSLEELSEGPASGPPGELPGGQRIFQAVAELADGLGGTRRDFLRRMGFGLAAATAAAGCSRIPERRALPLVEQPEGFLPGVASHYATACGGCAAGCGLLVKVRDGRPIKVEGNPGAPLAGGGTCAAGQATVLSLYDEGRLRGPLWLGRPASWEEVDAGVAERLAAVAARGGRIVLLTGTPLGPASRGLAAEWLARFPAGRHVAYDPLSLTGLRLATGRGFGRPVVPHLRLDRARLVVGIEADFLGTWLSPVELTRQYAEMRRPRGEPGAEEMGRHIQIEAGLSLTGSNADRRFAVRPSELGLAALALLAGVARRAGAGAPEATGLPARQDTAALDRVAAELWRLRGESLVVCGANDLALQLVVHRINSLLGNVGRTLDLDNPSLQAPGDDRAATALIDEMERGEVQALVVWGANPVYELPEGERFRRGLGRVALSVSFADRADETAAHVHAVCPDHHFLESWGDAEPVSGRLLLRQPTIAPLFATRAAQDSLLRWLGRETGWLACLQDHWRREVFPRQGGSARFEDFWDRALEAGGIALPEAEALAWEDRSRLDPAMPEVAELVERARQGEAARQAGELEVHLYPSVALRDGRGANNPWLQELPDPVARTAWGNHAALAPTLAARLGLADGDLVSLVGVGTALELPVHVQPGLAPDVVAVAVGYGRTRAGKVADGLGANAWPLLRREAGLAWGAMTVRLAPAGRRRELAQVQRHGSLEGRPIVRETTLAALRPPAGDGHGEGRHDLPSLWPEHPVEGPSWGLAIDLAACTGCAACVVACQAENNVPVVGPDEVRRGREMHWLRIDRYYSGPPEAPEVVYQPMLCQHCGHAPCETVCPVLATVHSSDGLNQQVYNRCVGTRYCANNCPYKVRRFNWFDYADGDRFDYVAASELGRMVLNPDVVVRSRGVMEKCSLCIQRIQDGKQEAARRGTPVPDGAVQTACQEACPADAIVFGDRHDPESAVARRQEDPRAYRVLEDLGTRPAVAYLAKVRNPL